MKEFYYKKGDLFAEEVKIKDIANHIKTPFYAYSKLAMERRFDQLKNSLGTLRNRIFYSVKANSNISVLKIFGSLGSGMDVVSLGEYDRAKAAGIAGKDIVFSGVGKTKSEIQSVIIGGIRQFNIESEPELNLVNQVATEMGKVIDVSIRVNPEVDAKTHRKITTGTKSDKFGVSFENVKMMFEKGTEMKGVSFVGLDMHIGSQISTLNAFRLSFSRLRKMTLELRRSGHALSRLDVGGGIGIEHNLNGDSSIPIDSYSALLKEYFDDLDCEIELEPGRSLVGNAGILVASVIYPKLGDENNFLIIDAAMNDFLRPALYEAHHQLLVVKKSSKKENGLFDIVGPVCESSDTFERSVNLPPMQSGDLVAFSSAGAYGAVMASEYNTRPLIPEVLISDNLYAIIRERPSISEIILRDKIPEWL